MASFTPISEDFNGNPLEFETGFGQTYDDFGLEETGSPSGEIHDYDVFSVADSASTRSSSTAISSSDSFSFAEATPSIALSFSDSASVTSTQAAVAQGPTPSDQDFFTVSDAPSTLTVSVASSDTLTFAESPPAIIVHAPNSVQDSDAFAFNDSVFSNSSGGVGGAFIGVVIGFDDTTLASNPAWTRLDQPGGVR